ncbi:MAG: tetratricopeptide repeat protein, partial [Candidatus Tectimicrobiota bacterium]
MGSLGQVGERLQNRWEICAVRQGTPGPVYTVYDHTTHQPYTARLLEVLPEAEPATASSRVTQAAQTWLALPPHPYIVRAHCLESINGQLVLFTEYVSGGSVQDWLGLPRLTQDPRQMLRLAMQCCEALGHAASHGMPAHGALQPQHCLLTQEGGLKLTHYGFGLLPEYSLKAEQSYAYRAPEYETAGGPATLQMDIYAFGVLLFHMATGKLPFSADTAQDYAQLQRTAAVPALAAPYEALTPLVTACLAPESAHRGTDFASIRVQLAEVYNAITGLPAPGAAALERLELDAWLNIGLGLENLGRHQEALAAYDRVLASDSRHDSAWVHRGTVLEALGRLDEALQCCDNALQVNPQSDQALVEKGMMLAARGQMEEARAFCDRALKINPRNEQAWVNMGAALDALGRQMEALGCYNNALTLNPRNEQAWFNSGVLLGELGRHQEALGCCQRTLTLNPRNEQAWVNSGLTLGELERPDEALACFDRAITLNPKLEYAWFNKGVTLVNAFERYAEIGRA